MLGDAILHAVPTPRLTVTCTLALLAGCAGEAAPPPSAAPAHTAAPAPPAPEPARAPAPATQPDPAPPLESAAWKPIEGKPAACPDGEQRCIRIQLPTDGYLSFEGTSPHDWGCRHFTNGRILAEVKDRELHLHMDGGAHAGLSGRICRALATLRGRGATGLLGAGAWLLVPDDGAMKRQSPLSPLHLKDLWFAPKGSR